MTSLIKIVFIICVLSVNVFTQVKYWEDLSKEEQDKILKSANVYKPVLDYYNGKFKAGDDPQTWQLLDTVTSKNVKNNPLYLYVFNKILSEAGGALAKIMGKYCYKIILGSMDMIISYLTKDRLASLSESYYKKYGSSLGWQLAADVNTKVITADDYKKFKDLFVMLFKNKPKDDRETIDLLIQEIDAAYKKY